MTVARDHDVEPGRCRLHIKLREIVQQVDGNAAKLDNVSVRQLTGPYSLVDVAADSSQGCDRGELRQNLGRTDVSGVQDVV